MTWSIDSLYCERCIICSKLETESPMACEHVWSRFRIYALSNTGFGHCRKEALYFTKHSSWIFLLVQVNVDSTCHHQKKHDSVPVIDHRLASDLLFFLSFFFSTNAETKRLDSDQVDGARQASAIYLHNVAGCLSDSQTDSWPDTRFMYFGLLLLCLWSNIPVF